MAITGASKASPSRQVMITALEEVAEDNIDLDALLEDTSLYDVTGIQLRRLYREYVLANASATAPTKTNEEPKTMEQFTANAVVNKKNRTVDITVEDNVGRFLTPDNKRNERAIGEDVPVYMTMPQEVYEAIRRA